MSWLIPPPPAAAMPSHPPVHWQIRPVEAADGRRLHAACYPHLPYSQFLTKLERFCRWQHSGRALYLVAAAPPAEPDAAATSHRSGGDLLAGGILMTYPRYGEIAELYVVPRCRGLGIGTAVVERLLVTAVAWGLPAVEIGVTAGNDSASRLYQRLGFLFDREIVLPGDGQKALILRRDL
jgi:GNAT superfamily N-acetyltransferase